MNLASNYSPVSTGVAITRTLGSSKVRAVGSGRYHALRLTRDEFTDYESYDVLDWDGFGALPISPHTVSAARSFKRLFSLNMPVPDIAPGADGTIGFEWHIPTPGYEAAIFIDVGPGGRVYARRLYLDGKVQKLPPTRVETGARQLLQQLFSA